MTLREIKIEVLNAYRSKGIKPTFSAFRREVRDRVHYETTTGMCFGSTYGTPAVWKINKRR